MLMTLRAAGCVRWVGASNRGFGGLYWRATMLGLLVDLSCGWTPCEDGKPLNQKAKPEEIVIRISRSVCCIPQGLRDALS